ncbi:MAG: hypothetical protein IID00_04300 [Chloroflexi bacterium]|nr:hypothetical protein [Chloroflexota bacterium]
MTRTILSTTILLGAVLGLAAFFLDWTGDGRGIDYIRPASRFQSGYELPVPLTILAVGAAVAVGAMFLSAVVSIVDLRREHSTFRWMGGIGGFVLATLPLAAHGGYWFWFCWYDGGVVFRSGDWGAGLWLALAGGSLALAGTVISTRRSRGRS